MGGLSPFMHIKHAHRIIKIHKHANIIIRNIAESHTQKEISINFIILMKNRIFFGHFWLIEILNKTFFRGMAIDREIQ